MTESAPISSWLALAMLGLTIPSGCSPNASVSRDSASNETSKFAQPKQIALVQAQPPKKDHGIIAAQGRLQPEKGIVRIVAIPGDTIQSVMVEPGQSVAKGKKLVTLESEQLHSIELETASLRLQEAKSALEAKQSEADLAIEEAALNIQVAQQNLKQAKAQTTTLDTFANQITELSRQITSLERLHSNKLTAAAVGSMELVEKRVELDKLKSTMAQSKLTIEQGIELAQLRNTQADHAWNAAKRTRVLVDQGAPIRSLEKQVEVLQMQLRQSAVLSPIDGVVTSVNALEGERTSQLPLMEIASLDSMVCVAEVHEADVARVAIHAPAEMKSPALARPLHGKVLRIDRSVGSAQLRFPNPMARSDFRSVQVWILIDAADVPIASERLQLQVDVSITTSGSATH